MTNFDLPFWMEWHLLMRRHLGWATEYVFTACVIGLILAAGKLFGCIRRNVRLWRQSSARQRRARGAIKLNVTVRLLELAFGFVTAAASVVLAYVAVLALQEARREWFVVPAPENFAGRLLDNGKVHLSWEPPATGIDMIREIVVLHWSSQGKEPWGVMKPIEKLPPEAKFYNGAECKDSDNAAPMMCIYSVRVVAANGRLGKLSRPVICVSEECEHFPAENLFGPLEPLWRP